MPGSRAGALPARARMIARYTNANGCALTASAFRRPSPTVFCASAAVNIWWCFSPTLPSAVAPAPSYRKARRVSRQWPATCPGWCSAWSGTGRRNRCEWPISAKPVSAWWAIPPSACCSRDLASAAWCTPMTRQATGPASSWHWRKARTGAGRGAFSIATAKCVGRISAPPCAASRMAARYGTASSGISPTTSASSWSWMPRARSCASWPRTWRPCARRRRRISPAKCTTSWARC